MEWERWIDIDHANRDFQEQIKRLKSKGYRVINAKTGRIHSKSTTLEKAKAQKRLLDSIDVKKSLLDK